MNELAPVIDLTARRREVDRLVEQNLDLAQILTKCVATRWDFDDLHAAALEGLWQAARRYDPHNAEGASFRTFAEHRIRGALLDQQRAADRLSRVTRRNVRRLERSEEELLAAMQRHPTAVEVAKDAGFDRRRADQLAQAQWRAKDPVRLDGPADHHYRLHEVIPADVVELDEQAEALEDLVESTLTGRQLEVVRMYLDGHTYLAIAAVLGVTESRISQIIHAAARRLREAAKLTGLLDPDVA